MNSSLLQYINHERSLSSIIIAGDVEESIEKLINDSKYEYLLSRNYPNDIMDIVRENPYVNLPVIFQDADRMIEDRDEVLVDPPNINKAVRLSNYLAYQRRFFSLQFINKGERSNFLISRAFHYASNFYNQDELLDLAGRLYQNGWILGAYKTAQLKMHILSLGDNKKFEEMCQDTALICQMSDSLKLKIEQSKELSTNLNEWLKRIHDLLPDVLLVGLMAGWNKDEESEKICRYFDEVQADIGTTISICTSAVVRQEKFPMTSEYLFKKDIFNEKTEKERIRDIRYHYKARTILPKFWYEEAKKTIENSLSMPPEILDDYNPLIVLGLGITMNEADDMFMSFM